MGCRVGAARGAVCGAVRGEVRGEAARVGLTVGCTVDGGLRVTGMVGSRSGRSCCWAVGAAVGLGHVEEGRPLAAREALEDLDGALSSRCVRAVWVGGAVAWRAGGAVGGGGPVLGAPRPAGGGDIALTPAAEEGAAGGDPVVSALRSVPLAWGWAKDWALPCGRTVGGAETT